MTAVIATPPFLAFYDLNGNPLSGGKIYTYAAGTTTPKATYTDQTAATPMSNPIILDSAGRATWWISGSYKYVVKDANDTTITTTDNVTSFTTLAEQASAFFQSFSGNGSTTAFTLSSALGTEEKALMVFVDAGAGKGYDILAPTAFTVNGTALTFNSAPASGTNNIYVFAPALLLGAASAAAAAAETSATNALASEVAAAASETAAAGSASSASTSASTATTQASNASSSASAASTSASTATTQASNASTSATNAQNYAAALNATSTTSLAIATGSKSFTTQSGKQFAAGQFVLAVDSANNANYMQGQVTSYSGTSLIIDVQNISGSGTIADWKIYMSGHFGADGADGIAQFRSGSGVPSSGLGNDGDCYFDTASASVYIKVAGAWVLQFAVSGGAMVLLATATASASSTIDFTSGIDSTYTKYIVDISNLTMGTDSSILFMRLQQGGSFVTSNNYTYTVNYINASALQVADYQNNQGQLKISNDLDSAAPSAARVEVFNPSLAKYTHAIWHTSSVNGGDGSIYSNVAGGALKLNAATTGIRFFTNTGNIATGTFKLYGVT